MAVGFPTKANWAAGDVLTASALDDLAGTVNLLSNATATSGSQLVSNAAGTSVAYVATPSASNPVLNSGFNVWQRGTSIAVAASSQVYTADRWQIQTNANTATTVARYATNDTTNLPFIQYCARFQRNSGQTGAGFSVAQSFETINSVPFAGKQITYSFYARAGADYSPTSKLLTRGLIGGTGTDQNFFSGYTSQANYGFGTVTLTTTWQRFTVTDTIGSTITELAPYFSISSTGTAVTNDYFEVTGVQIDIGPVALPYRGCAATYQQELAACQRYYYRVGGSSAYSYFGSGAFLSTTATRYVVNYPVTLRTAPTFNSSAANTFLVMSSGNTGGDAPSAIGTDNLSNNAAAVNLTSTARTAGIGAMFLANNNLNTYLEFSAEL